MTTCEKVNITRNGYEYEYLVQYDDQHDADERKSCLDYLTDCGYKITTTNHPIQEHDGQEPCVSWSDLSDIIEPGDR